MLIYFNIVTNDLANIRRRSILTQHSVKVLIAHSIPINSTLYSIYEHSINCISI
jgi:hypothetical protein